jgi:hypothetical protein
MNLNLHNVLTAIIAKYGCDWKTTGTDRSNENTMKQIFVLKMQFSAKISTRI